MGFTWEVPAHLAYKRARVLATQFGSADALAERLADARWPTVTAPSGRGPEPDPTDRDDRYATPGRDPSK